eukprot:6944699-Prymnesium_polylepis.1
MARLNMSASDRRDATLKELPADVRERVEKLEKMQESVDELQAEFDKKLEELRNEFEGKKAPHYKSRAQIVIGANAEAPGVPDFWLQAFQNNMILAEEVQKADEDALKHLTDIKASTKLSDGKKGFQLAFCFSPNPYFENEVLTKTYLLDPDDEDECLQKSVGCDIAWKPGKNVTVKVVQKKQKKKGKVRTVKVEEQTESFFNFFDPPDVPEEEDEMEEEEMEQLQEQLEND